MSYPTDSADYKPMPEVGLCFCGERFKIWLNDGQLACNSCGQIFFVLEEVCEQK